MGATKEKRAKVWVETLKKAESMPGCLRAVGKTVEATPIMDVRG